MSAPKSGRARHLLEGVLPFIGTGLLFGLLYNTLFYPRTPVEYLEAGTIGVLLGAILGVAEQTFLNRRLQQRPFGQAIVIRTLGYSVAVALALSLVLSIEPAAGGECRYFECVGDYIGGSFFLRDLTFSTLFVGFAAFSAQLVLLIGTRNFARLVSGQYRKPRDVDATFMFVDIRGSTGLAEELGHERYSALLSDFFNDVSHAVHSAKGEVYQYVGDEVVVVWPGTTHSGRWLSCFIGMRATLVDRHDEYDRKYGTVPEFKAGVHVGNVIVTEVGTLRRAHVYHGDVLNTAARIQGECNEAGYDLLISEAALASVASQSRQDFVSIGEMPLRGKSELVEVFGFTGAVR